MDMVDVEDAPLHGTSFRDASSTNFDITEPEKAVSASKNVVNSTSDLEIDQRAGSLGPNALSGTDTAVTTGDSDDFGLNARASTAFVNSDAADRLGADKDLPISGDGGQPLGLGDGDLAAAGDAVSAGSGDPGDDAFNPDAARGSTSGEDSQIAAEIAGPMKSTHTGPTADADTCASTAATVGDTADAAAETAVDSTRQAATSSIVVTQTGGGTSDLGWMSVTTGELASTILTIDSKRDGASNTKEAPLTEAASAPSTYSADGTEIAAQSNGRNPADSAHDDLGADITGAAASSAGDSLNIRVPDTHRGSAIGEAKHKSVDIVTPVDSVEQTATVDANPDADASPVADAGDGGADAHAGSAIINPRQTVISGVIDITRPSGVASDLPSMLSVNTSDLGWTTTSAISKGEDVAAADQEAPAEPPSAPPTGSAVSAETLAQSDGGNTADVLIGTKSRASAEGPVKRFEDERSETGATGEEGAGGVLRTSGPDGEPDAGTDADAQALRVSSPGEAAGGEVRDRSSSSRGGGDADPAAAATTTTVDDASVPHIVSTSYVDSTPKVETVAAPAASASSQDGAAAPSGLGTRSSSREGGGGGTGGDRSGLLDQQQLPRTSRETTRNRSSIAESPSGSRPTSARPEGTARTGGASATASTVTTVMDVYSGDPRRSTAPHRRVSSVSSTLHNGGKRAGSASSGSSLSSVSLMRRSAGTAASPSGQVGGAVGGSTQPGSVSSSLHPRPESAAETGTSSSGRTAATDIADTGAAAGVSASGSGDGGRPSSATLRQESLGLHRRRSTQDESLISYTLPSAVTSSTGVVAGDLQDDSSEPQGGDLQEPRVGGTLEAIYWIPAEVSGGDEERGGRQGQADDGGEDEGEDGGDTASASRSLRAASAGAVSGAISGAVALRRSASGAWGRQTGSADGGGSRTSQPASQAVAVATPNHAVDERPGPSASTASAALPLTTATANTYDNGLSAATISAPSPPPPLPPRHRSQTEIIPMYGMPIGSLTATATASFNPVVERHPTSLNVTAPNAASAGQRPLTLLMSSVHGGMAMGVRPRSAVSAPAGSTAQRPSLSLTGLMTSLPAPGGGSSSLPQRPVHQLPTHVQPKGPLDDCTTQAASEHVRSVWSTSNICGIRSLPNALSPDFRDRLYDHLAAAAKQPENRPSTDQHKPSLSYGIEGGPLAMPLSVGQKQVARIHPLSGMFTQFEYLPSEYDRVKLTGKFDRLKHKLAQTAPSEFIVRSLPQALRGAPAFSEFSYCTDPVDSYISSMNAVTDLARSRIVAGPFYPSGRVQSSRILKGRLDECMMRLCRQLSDDWPSSFLQVFEDRNGSIVASFHRGAAVLEGDLSSYMNTLAKRNHVVATYQLLKDATRWGLVDGPSQTVFYVLWPPWVRHKYLGPHAAPISNEAVNGRSGTRNGSSSGEEEGGEGGEDGDQRITEPGWA